MVSKICLGIIFHEIMAIHHDRTTADFHHITLDPMQRLQFVISQIFFA